MTGFAREAGTTGPFQWVWEIKTVNGRGLDVRLRVPPGFDAIGEEARGQLQKALARGSCQVNLTLSRTAGAATIKVNENALASLTEALARLKLPDGVRPPSIVGLLAVRGVVEVEDEADDETARDELDRDLRAAVGRLIAAVREARQAESRAPAGALEGPLGAMELLFEAAGAAPARQPEAIRARLQEQVAALLDT